MKKWIKENKLLAVSALLGILGFLYIVINEFFFYTDSSGITGIEALKQAGGEFWGWAIGLSVLAGALVYFISRYVKAQGGVGVSLSILLPPLLLLCIAWGKGCDIKADGIGGAKHVPTEKVDDGRVPAQDLIPK